jgi:hypothetical protein
MSDVNPLGPLMHLKEVERAALAFRASTTSGRPGVLNAASGWMMSMVKRLNIPPRAVSTGNSAHIGKG